MKSRLLLTMSILFLIVSAITFVLDYNEDMRDKRINEQAQVFIVGDDLNWGQAIEAGESQQQYGSGGQNGAGGAVLPVALEEHENGAT